MKPKIIYTIIFSLIVFRAASQTTEETYLFAEQQYKAGHYQTALTEFQRVAFFDSNNQFGNIYNKIGDVAFAAGDINLAIKNYDIASRMEMNDSLKAEIIIKKALCYFNQDNYFFALSELLSVFPPQNSKTENKVNLYTGIAFFGIEDYSQSLVAFEKLVEEKNIPELNKLFGHFEKMEKRFRPGKIETMSILFPGLGQIYSGNTYAGINSVLLTGGIAFIAVWVWHTYGLLDALLSVSSWYYRYYTGGIKNAKSAAYKRIAEEKEKTYKQIIRLAEDNMQYAQ